VAEGDLVRTIRRRKQARLDRRAAAPTS